jgi:hypothetical protein
MAWPKRIPVFMDDMVMKMQASEPAFVDGLYAKFYSLSSELLLVGPKCSSSPERPGSFYPAEAVARSERAAGVPSGSLIVPAHAPLRWKEFLDPGVRNHHGRKP